MAVRAHRAPRRRSRVQSHEGQAHAVKPDLGDPDVQLTTTGTRSGRARTTTLLGLPTEGGVAVVASNFGQHKHPAWFHNLRANPECAVNVDGVTRTCRAVEAEGERRERIWEQGLRMYPGWSQYEERTPHRRIAVFVLEPLDPPNT